MDIIQWNFRAWCQKATSLIKFSPDRRVVEAELRQHLDDRYESLLEKGLSQEEASAKTLDAMGDPLDIAPQLAAIHRPFWGYCLRVCRIALVILLALGIIPIFQCFSALEYTAESHREFDVYSAESYGGDTGRTLLHLSHPEASFSSDGNTFTVTDAVVFTETSAATGQTGTRFYFLIEHSSLLPSFEHNDYQLWQPVTNWFSATDSLGRHYDGAFRRGDGISTIFSRSIRDGLFSRTIECEIFDFQSADAEWIDICYERDGRSFTLHIELSGGDGA